MRFGSEAEIIVFRVLREVAGFRVYELGFRGMFHGVGFGVAGAGIG